MKRTHFSISFGGLLFLFLFLTIISSAQDARLYGVIKDSSNRVLSGTSVTILNRPEGAVTNDNGRYELKVPSEQSLQIIFSFTGLKPDTILLSLKKNEKRELNVVLKGRTTILPEFTVQEKSLKDNNVIKINPKIVQIIPTPNQSVEDIIKTLPGVSSNNELSSTYSVRGGNYDENLVYVNDIEVYRPMLVRSGQQEGLSIINSDMVDNISFSAGGFDAKYGDKMSSVLDVSYHKPKRFAGSVSASLLGASLELENISKNKKFTYMGGLRYK